MRIQVIQHRNNSSEEKEGVFFSPISSPRAIDDFDINLIDLSVSAMWKYHGETNPGQVDVLPDLRTIQQMVLNKTKAIVVYVLPQNITYKYNLQFPSFCKEAPIKNILNGVMKYSVSNVVPKTIIMPDLAFETTNTDIGGKKYPADLNWLNSDKVITKSDRSEKATTIEIDEKIYATTLAITKTTADIKHYVSTLFEKHEREVAPEWMKNISFGDDALQNSQIEQSLAKIEAAKAIIETAENKLKENARYKSILYTNGDELVNVVFEILEKLFAYDLSDFVDEKKEDFRIKLPSCTFIGEIKGVTSNVKFEHISQVEVHYRRYLDSLAEEGISENIRQILIMNPFKSKALDKREPIHISQIELAVRNGCLIVETSTLLRLYEKFCNGEVTSQKCVEVFSKESGLLRLSSFEEISGDNEPYKI